MAKCLVGANGGGKVTIEGLTADVLLTGTIAKVLQGAKEVKSVNGALDVLAFGCPIGTMGNLYWNGESYVQAYTPASGSLTFSGTPMLVYAKNGLKGFSQEGTYPFPKLTVCGVDCTTQYELAQIHPVNSTISWTVSGQNSHGAWVMLGTKS